MRTEGFLAPETDEAACTTFEELGTTAQVLTREVAVAIGFDAEEYRERVTSEVVETAHEALFGSMLVVRTAERKPFEAWLDDPAYDGWDVTLEGGDNVANVAWHAAPLADRVLGATYESERNAAVATLRRIAWARLYRDIIH